MNTVATCDPGAMRNDFVKERGVARRSFDTLLFVLPSPPDTTKRISTSRAFNRDKHAGVKMKTGTPDLGPEQTSATSVGIISGKHSGDASSSAFPLPSFCSPSSSSSSSSYSPEPVRKKETSFKRGRLKQMSQQECRGEKEPELHLPSNNSR